MKLRSFALLAVFMVMAVAAMAQRQAVVAKKYPAFSIELPMGWLLKVEQSGSEQYPDNVYIFDGPEDFINLNGTFELLELEPEATFEMLKGQYLADLEGATSEGFDAASFSETTLASKPAIRYQFQLTEAGSVQIEQTYVIFLGPTAVQLKVYYPKGNADKAAAWEVVAQSIRFD
jgi:hypothetical protein